MSDAHDEVKQEEVSGDRDRAKESSPLPSEETDSGADETDSSMKSLSMSPKRAADQEQKEEEIEEEKEEEMEDEKEKVMQEWTKKEIEKEEIDEEYEEEEEEVEKEEEEVEEEENMGEEEEEETEMVLSSVHVPTSIETALAKQEEDKVEQMASQWVRNWCDKDEGSRTTRGELYATYAREMRNHHSLSCSVDMFTDTITAIFPGVQFNMITKPGGGIVTVVYGLRLLESPRTNEGGVDGKSMREEEKEDGVDRETITPQAPLAENVKSSPKEEDVEDEEEEKEDMEEDVEEEKEKGEEEKEENTEIKDADSAEKEEEVMEEEEEEEMEEEKEEGKEEAMEDEKEEVEELANKEIKKEEIDEDYGEEEEKEKMEEDMEKEEEEVEEEEAKKDTASISPEPPAIDEQILRVGGITLPGTKTEESKEEKKEEIEEEIKMEENMGEEEEKEEKKEEEKEMKMEDNMGEEEEKEEEKEMKKEESEEDDDEDNEEEEEEKKGLLEMSPVVEGKRKRESTSFFTMEQKVTPAKPKPKTPTMAGSGTALEDIPFIMHQIDGVKKVEDLRPLHHICYGSPGTPVKTVLRKELKKFNGFSFAKDSDAFKKRLLLINKYTKPELAHVCRLLGLEIYKDNNKPTKDAEVQRIMDFLANPHDEVKSLPKKAIKRMSEAKGKTPAKRAKNESDSGEMENDEKEEDKEEEDEEEEKDNDEEEEEEKEEAPKETPKKAAPKKGKAVEKKTKGKTPAKKAMKESASVDKERDEEEEEVKETPKKAAPKKGKAAEKKTKSQLTPSDKEVKAKIAELLGTMDLKKVTMKQSVAAVVAAFPAHRRELLKRTSSIEGFINTKLEELKGN